MSNAFVGKDQSVYIKSSVITASGNWSSALPVLSVEYEINTDTHMDKESTKSHSSGLLGMHSVTCNISFNLDKYVTSGSTQNEALAQSVPGTAITGMAHFTHTNASNNRLAFYSNDMVVVDRSIDIPSNGIVKLEVSYHVNYLVIGLASSIKTLSGR